MGILFEKNIHEFAEKTDERIGNRRITFAGCQFIKRVDLTFLTEEVLRKTGYPYLEDANAFRQLLPVPAFLLHPLQNYNLPYSTTDSGEIHFHGRKTVIYLHGSGSISEDNSILHRLLLRNGCDLIRISYHIDYAKEKIRNPQKADEMLPFLDQVEKKIAPAVNMELQSVLTGIKKEYPDLFANRDVTLIAHSLGGGLAANLAAGFSGFPFSRFINLDGTLMNPAIQTGLDIPQLHLSQDRLFKEEWIDAEDLKDPLAAIGQDYCRKINKLIANSSDKRLWLQIGGSTHFTFTDFPNLLKPYKVFKKLAGSVEAAQRIRNYAVGFICFPDCLKVYPGDHAIVIV
jgi:hypothetical protein